VSNYLSSHSALKRRDNVAAAHLNSLSSSRAVEQTGGSILVGEREGVDDLLIKLTGLIRSSYTIAYYPENSDFNGRFRRISLELSGRGKAKAGKVNIKTRNGYRALRPSLPDAAEIKN
jgi:hypothetical protein